MENRISLEELESEVAIMLRSLRVQFKRLHLVKDVSAQFVCDDFGLIVNAMNRADYGFVKKEVVEAMPNYRYFFISNFDNILEAKENLIWALMVGGYMKYIRFNYPRQFTELITMQNFGNRIIQERLNRFADRPKYAFFIEENEWARNVPSTMVLSKDPGFFDYMPEGVE